MPTASHMPSDLDKQGGDNVAHSFNRFTLSARGGALCPIFAPLWVHLCPCDQDRASHIGQNDSHRVEKGRSSAKYPTLVQFSFTVQKIQLRAGEEGLRRRDSTRESRYGAEPVRGEWRSGPVAVGDAAGGAFPARVPSTAPRSVSLRNGCRGTGGGRSMPQVLAQSRTVGLCSLVSEVRSTLCGHCADISRIHPSGSADYGIGSCRASLGPLLPHQHRSPTSTPSPTPPTIR